MPNIQSFGPGAENSMWDGNFVVPGEVVDGKEPVQLLMVQIQDDIDDKWVPVQVLRIQINCHR